MNAINIIGRMVNDPELKHTNSDIAVCSFTLAVKRPRSKDTTDFLECVSWRQSAEYLSKYGSKGSMVAVNGVLTTRKYEDKNGNKRTAYEIVANDLQVLQNRLENSEGNFTPNNQNGQNGASVAKTEAFAQNAETFEDVSGLYGDSDLPF